MRPTSMSINLVNQAEWNEFLRTTEARSPFHSPDWLGVVERWSRLRVVYILGGSKDSPVVGLPAFLGRRGPLAVFFSPPPNFAIPFLGPVFRETYRLREEKRRTALREFTQELAMRWFRKLWGIVKIDSGPWHWDLRPFIEAGLEAIPRYTYTIDLSRGYEPIAEGMQKYLRRELKVHSNEYVFRVANSSERSAVLEHLEARYNRKGETLKVPKTYVDDLFVKLPENRLRVFVLMKDGDFATGSIGICYENVLYNWLGNPRVPPEFQYANEVLLDQMIRWGTAQGYRRFDMMGSNSRDIAYFKAKFNPTLVSYSSARRIPMPLKLFVRLRS